MRTLLGVLVVAVCLAPAASATPLASNEQVTITVTVEDAGGDAVGGANVTVSYDDTTKTETTFSNGKALFDVPEGADVKVDATHSELALNHPKTVRDADGSSEVTLTMYPSSTAVVTVKTPGGDPIEGANVRLQKNDEVLPVVRGQTAANGTLVSKNLEQGAYSVKVERSGYYDVETTLSVVNRAGKTVTLESGTVAIEFETVDEHDGARDPVSANVVISADEQIGNLSTGSSGKRTVSLDVNTRYSVVVKKNGFEQERHVLQTGETDSSVTYELNRTPSLSLSAANSQVVTGQSVRLSVTDEYGDPVEGASLRVGGETVGETDENGEAQVTIEEDGEVEITAISGSVEASTVVEGVSASTDEPTTTEPTTESTTTEPTTTELTTELTTEATTEPTDEPTEDDAVPGFGALVAVVALGLSIVALGRRDDS